VTDQRALILEIVRRGRGHLDAQEVYLQARKKQPRLALSTVYRNLQALKNMGLIEEVQFGEVYRRYEVKPSVEHHHLLCLGCGRVVEFQGQLSRYIRRNVAQARDFEIVDTKVRITGYCADCRSNK